MPIVYRGRVFSVEVDRKRFPNGQEEEIGLTPHTVKRIRGLFPTPGFCDEELIFYRVWDLRKPPADSPHKPDEDEDIRAQPFSVAEARAMVERGEIIDLKTAYGLTL